MTVIPGEKKWGEEIFVGLSESGGTTECFAFADSAITHFLWKNLNLPVGSSWVALDTALDNAS